MQPQAPCFPAGPMVPAPPAPTDDALQDIMQGGGGFCTGDYDESSGCWNHIVDRTTTTVPTRPTRESRDEISQVLEECKKHITCVAADSNKEEFSPQEWEAHWIHVDALASAILDLTQRIPLVLDALDEADVASQLPTPQRHPVAEQNLLVQHFVGWAAQGTRNMVNAHMKEAEELRTVVRNLQGEVESLRHTNTALEERTRQMQVHQEATMGIDAVVESLEQQHRDEIEGHVKDKKENEERLRRLEAELAHYRDTVYNIYVDAGHILGERIPGGLPD